MPEEPNVSPKPGFAIILLFAAVAGLAIALFYTVNQLHSVESKLTALVQADKARTHEWAAGEIAKIHEASAADAANREKTLDAMRDEMDKAKRQARGVAGRVKEEALKSVQELAGRLDANEKKLKEQQMLVASELHGVKQAASTTQTNIAAVSTEVRDVRTDVANTRTQLDRTIADLHRATGDMGVLSGLIATNGKEIAALKVLGDRTYTEFAIPKNKKAVQVADVWMLLKKADAGHNRYTLEVRADDHMIEKRDRTANEPVQFYVGRNKQPYEIVVNQVQKDQVVGYLASPKAVAIRQ